MLFNSIEYLLFLAIAWTLFWTVPTRHRVTVLLLASYAFYASWSAPYAAMVFGLVIVNYLFGLVLARTRRHRRFALGAFVAFDLAVLGVFKYFDFATRSLAGGAAALLGVTLDPPLLHLVLPLGIS